MKQEIPQGWLILKTDDVKDAIKECFEGGDPGCVFTYQKGMCGDSALQLSALCRICKAATGDIKSGLGKKK